MQISVVASAIMVELVDTQDLGSCFKSELSLSTLPLLNENEGYGPKARLPLQRLDEVVAYFYPSEIEYGT